VSRPPTSSPGDHPRRAVSVQYSTVQYLGTLKPGHFETAQYSPVRSSSSPFQSSPVQYCALLYTTVQNTTENGSS